MIRITAIITALLILLNAICGLVLPQYESINIVLSSAVIILNAGLISVASRILNDAFKISLSFLFSFLCLIECVLAVLSPQEVESNYYIIGICAIFIFEVIVLTCAKFCQQE